MRAELATDTLVAAARTGDEQATSALYRCEFPRLVSLVRSYVPSQAAAEDVAQDALLKALRRLPDLRNDKAWRSWVASIARNTALDRQRREGTLELRAEVGEPTRRAPASESPMESDAPALDRLIEAWGRLRPGDRKILAMAVIREMETAEVAEALAINHDAVYQRLSRAKHRLRSVLGAGWLG